MNTYNFTTENSIICLTVDGHVGRQFKRVTVVGI
jgi:hypothetical protein